MLRDSAEQKYVVLNISKGLNFDCLKNVVLRVSTVLQNERLTSNYLLSTPEPNFNVNFVWCTSARHINLLQKRCCNIKIAISAISASKTWTAGCAMIGIQHAQLFIPDVKLSTRRFPIYDVKTNTQVVLQPELVATLSIRSEPPLNIDSQLHSVNLSDSTIVCRPRSSTSSATTRTKKGQEENSQESLNLLSQPHSYQKQKTYKDRNNNSTQTTCNSTETEQEIPKSHDCTPTLPNNMRIPSRIRLIVQNIDRSKMASLGVYGSSSTFQMIGQPPPTRKPEVQMRKFHYQIPVPHKNMIDRSNMASIGVYSSSNTFKMIDQPVKLRDYTSILPSNVRIPSRVRLIVQNIDRSKMASLGVYGSSSTFQMIGQPPPTRKPEVQMRKFHYQFPVVPHKNMNILNIKNATSSVPMVTEATEAKEEEIEIQKSHDQSAAPTASAPLRKILGTSSKTHVKVKNSVRFKEDTDMKQC